jgi:hypothetical protein
VAAQREGVRSNEQWASALQQRGLREEAQLEHRGVMLGGRRQPGPVATCRRGAVAG